MAQRVAEEVGDGAGQRVRARADDDIVAERYCRTVGCPAIGDDLTQQRREIGARDRFGFKPPREIEKLTEHGFDAVDLPHRDIP